MQDYTSGALDGYDKEDCLPLWRQYRQELNRAPLGHDEWAE